MNRPESESASNAVPADRTSERPTESSETRAADAPAPARESGKHPTALGGYRIEKLLGEGGMGAVYRARDEKLDRAVALKTMRPEIAAQPGAVERFLREARAVAKVRHDNVIEIWYIGEDAGAPYIAMPLLEGEPLNEWLKREPVPPLGVTLKVGRETADGLEAAHARGLVHRDIKPANLWIEGDPASDDLAKQFRRVKVLDFGLARPANDDTQLTGTGAVLGTPAYMSPEQARGAQVDHRTDLFSLGIVLYRMATGVLPFTGATTMAVLTSLAVDEPPSPLVLNPDLPPALSDLIVRLLSKDRDKRPARAADVAATLREIGKRVVASRKAAAAPPAADDIPTAANVSQSLPVVVYPQPVPVAPVPNAFAELEGTDLPARSGEVGAATEPRPTRKGLSAGTWAAMGAALLLAMGGVVAAIKYTQKKPDPAPDETAKENPKGSPKPDEPKPIPPAPKVDPKPPVQVADPDRAAARAVLALKGWIEINVSNRNVAVRTAAELPLGPFELLAADLSDTAATDADLAPFAGTTAVRSLALIRTKIAGPGLTNVAGNTELTGLILSGTLVTDEALTHLANHKKLSTLILHGTKITDKGMKAVGERHTLETLILSQTVVSDPGLMALINLRKLGTLDLRDTTVSEVGVRDLANRLPQCRIVWKGGTVEPKLDADRAAAVWAFGAGAKVTIHDGKTPNATVNRAADLPAGPFAVTKLDFSPRTASIDDMGLKQLEALKQLSYLNVGGSRITDAGLASVAKVTSIYTLNLKNTAVTDTGLDQLKALDKLAVVDVTGTTVTEAGALKFAKALPKCLVIWTGGVIQPQGSGRAAAEWALSVGGAVRLVNRAEVQIREPKDMPGGPLLLQEIDLGSRSNVTDDDLIRVAALDGLTRFYVASPALTDAALAHFKNKKDMYALGIVSPKITDAGLAHLAGLNLQTLFLPDTSVSDAGLKHLQNMGRMNTLRLERTKVTGPGLEHLQNLKALQHLALSDTPLTDEGLKHLALLPRLELLDLKGTKVTAQGVATLQKALPKCKITFGSRARDAAEWALSIGGKLTLTDGLRQLDVAAAKDLPAGPLVITRIDVGPAGMKVADADLARLHGLSDLKNLHLNGSGVTSAGLEHLKGLTGLASLDLRFTTITDAGLIHLKGLTGLRQLSLTETAITDAGLVHLGALTELVSLDVRGTKVTAAGVAALQKALPKCKINSDVGKKSADNRAVAEWVFAQGGNVNIRGRDGSDRQLSAAKDLPKDEAIIVTRIELIGCKSATDAELARLKDVPELAHLQLTSAPITGTGVAHLKGLPKLANLYLSGAPVGDDGAAHLGAMPALRHLDVRGTGITDDGLQHIGKLKELVELSLQGQKITNAGLAHLAWLTDLGTLTVSYTQVTDPGLVALKRMTKLQHLSLKGTRVTGTGLVHLKDAPLTELDLSDTGLTAAGFANIKNVVGLNRLLLDNTPITDGALAHLANLKALTVLRLGGTKVTDAGLHHLKAVPDLKFLNLERTAITDAGLDQLKELAGLTSLNLAGTKVTAAGLQKLKAALPKCSVSADDLKP